MYQYIDEDHDTEYERELELESLTAAYMRGEIKLLEYRRRISDYQTRLDLRKAASKLKPPSLQKQVVGDY